MELICKKILSVACLFLYVLFVAGEPIVIPICNKDQCPGPLKFYKEFGCKPVYRNEGDCCAYKYDCDHLNNRSTEKCYIKGYEYKIGESLRKEHAGLCDIGCSCRQKEGRAEFSCAAVDCPTTPDRSCYIRWSANACCGELVCPKTLDDRPTCRVQGGGIVMDGLDFYPDDQPNTICFCNANYTGQNVAPFCRPMEECRTELHYPHIITNKCSPTYNPGQSPQTDCSWDYRCPNQQDEVIKPKRRDPEYSDGVICYFGNLTMEVGDELKPATDHSSVCVRCICEAGPLPTCRRLYPDVCDAMFHRDSKDRKN